MNAGERKQAIEDALNALAARPLYEAGLGLLDALGYRSDRTLRLREVEEFRSAFDQHGQLNADAARTEDWLDVAFLRQITSDDVAISAEAALPFQRDYAPTDMQSYVFVAVELRNQAYTRSELSRITRAVNRIFSMPAMLLFKYGGRLTLAIIDRRPNRRDEARDALEKVTLVKDIAFADPLRAHVDILHDLSLEALHEDFFFHNFAGLHEAWRKRLGGLALNERFYREVANWYFWALTSPGVVLPRSVENNPNAPEREKQRAIFFIRLLTRLIFCWFLQEKGLVPRDLFRPRVAEQLLKDSSPAAGTYYKAFLQNLFFATLNQEQGERGWRRKYPGSRDGNRGITNLWRYRDLLVSPDEFETLLRERVPFVNGGLFDCLDDVRDESGTPNARLDDFSEERENDLCLPNDLFFGDERTVDLSTIYEDARRKKEKVSGLVEILSRYKFTIEENTPLEEEIALDPELLGKVFENLLASYNEDTRTTARKALGAFYTRREIVSYMVTEALVSYLSGQVPSVPEPTLRVLFDDTAPPPDLPPADKAKLVAAIGKVKVLDPACGSGAFPMGALHRLVDLLQRLDPNNESWKRDRLADAHRYYELLRQANAPSGELEECENRIADIEHSFDTRFHALDFGRKLYLIEECIYGVDIEPIACQIAKLRFFVALIVDQRVDRSAPNLGVRPLPNLETKIVAANTLVGLRPSNQPFLWSEAVIAKESKLRQVRQSYFLARTPRTKAKFRDEDARLRAEIAALLKDEGLDPETGRRLASWDPYDQDAATDFFDPEWMFGLPVGTVHLKSATAATVRGGFALFNQAGGQMELLERREFESGFDIVIGNPPYVRIQTLNQQSPELVKRYKRDYESAKKGNYDLYVVFVEAGLRFLKPDGHLAYILPHKFFNAQYGEPLRGLLAKGHHLQHIVHFGDQQVFPGATNYVCLLFLAKAGSESCRYQRADNLDTWLRSFTGPERQFSATSITAAEWNFVVGQSADVFRRLASLGPTLGEMPVKIFQGLVTGSDSVFVLRKAETPGYFFSDATGATHELETELLHPLCKDGVDVRKWHVWPPDREILFPYWVRHGEATLISDKEMVSHFPKVWIYLQLNRVRLEEREGGKWQHKNWYAFGRSQNLTEMEQPKLIVQVIAQSPIFAFDDIGLYFTGGGNGPYYGVRTLGDQNSRSLYPLQALLNSRVSDYFVRKVSTTFRGGYWSYGKRFIEQIPIVLGTQTQETTIMKAVERLQWLSRRLRAHPEDRTARDALMIGYWEQVLNGLVYELYFPEDLHDHHLRLFDLVEQAKIPQVDGVPEAQRLDRLRAEFERLYDLGHPLRSALHDLQTVDVVRIIEGET